MMVQKFIFGTFQKWSVDVNWKGGGGGWSPSLTLKTFLAGEATMMMMMMIGGGGGGGSGGGDINDDSHFYDEIVINGDGNFSSRQSLGFKRKPDMTSGRELFDTHHFSNINVHSKYPHYLSHRERPHSFPLAKLVLCSRRPVQ